MKYFIYFFTIVLLLGVNIGLFSYFKVAQVAPNLLLILVAVAALEKFGDYDYFFLALVSGIFLDFYTGIFPGSFTLAFLLLGIMLRLLVGQVLIPEVNWKSLSAFLAVAVFFTAMFVRIYASMAYKVSWSHQFLDFQGFWGKTFVELVYDLLMLYPIAQLVRFLKSVNETLLAKQRRLN